MTEAGAQERAAGGVTTSGAEWVARFATLVGVPEPSEEEIDDLLGVAGIAAHASERTAAPLSTWLAGRAGISAVEAKALAQQLAAETSGVHPEP